MFTQEFKHSPKLSQVQGGFAQRPAQASLFKMTALVEKVETEMEDVTHQISQEERTLESGSSKPDMQKKYGSRFYNVAVLSVLLAFFQVWNGLSGYSRGEHC